MLSSHSNTLKQVELHFSQSKHRVMKDSPFNEPWPASMPLLEELKLTHFGVRTLQSLAVSSMPLMASMELRSHRQVLGLPGGLLLRRDLAWLAGFACGRGQPGLLLRQPRVRAGRAYECPMCMHAMQL